MEVKKSRQVEGREDNCVLSDKDHRFALPAN